MISKNPYQGHCPKLVLALDVGMIYSSVSYCILLPGQVPKVCGVSRYPAQEHIGGDSRIPSILYYDEQGAVRAIGAEARQEHVIEQAEEEDWVKVEWWRLHLRSKHLSSFNMKDEDIPPLPPGKSAIQILGDFMRYLFSCARNYIVEAAGSSLWRSIENNIQFMITHPNGWDGQQQMQVRRAAVIAGLVPSGVEHQDRIRLLTEGEALLQFYVTNLLASDSLPAIECSSTNALGVQVESKYQGVIIIDAGCGTIDLSAYSAKLSAPRPFIEIAPAECLLQGSAFVTKRARAFLRAKLTNSRYGTPEVLQQLTEIFQSTTRVRFCDASQPQYIKFGTVRDKDLQYDIRSGQLRISGESVAQFFEPSIQAIVDAFQRQCAATHINIEHAFLVGSFAASDFLYKSLLLHPVFSQVHLCRHARRNIADGAISFYIDHVLSRSNI